MRLYSYLAKREENIDQAVGLFYGYAKILDKVYSVFAKVLYLAKDQSNKVVFERVKRGLCIYSKPFPPTSIFYQMLIKCLLNAYQMPIRCLSDVKLTHPC